MARMTRPLLDVWTSHKISLGTSPATRVELQGYCYTGFHMDHYDRSDGAWTIHLIHNLDRDAAATFYKGRNKFMQLAAELLKMVGEPGGYAEVWTNTDPSSDEYLDIMVKLGKFGDPPSWPLATQFNSREATGISLPQLGAMYWFNKATSSWEAYASPGEGNLNSFRHDGVWFRRPAGAWSPCVEHFGLRPGDIVTSSREAESPYSAAQGTRLVWGTKTLLVGWLDLVPAADIYPILAADLPAEGWAAKASRKAWFSGYSTLGGLWPWLMASSPQGRSLLANSGGAWRDLSKEWDASYGKPAIWYLDDSAIGRGMAMRHLRVVSPQWPNLFQDPTPTSLLDSSEVGTRFSQRDNLVRHVTLPPDTTLDTVLEDRTQGRLFRVTLPLQDVTPPTLQYKFFGNNVWEAQRVLPQPPTV